MLTKLQKFFANRDCAPYLVGGYLRDSLLFRTPGQDIDLALQGDTLALGQALAQDQGGTLVPLGKALGKCRVVVPEAGIGNWNIDLSAIHGTIEEDLTQRDFTINAMALAMPFWGQPEQGEQVIDPQQVIDPLNGRWDLANKCIRATGESVFLEDPLRLLRSVRLAASLGFRMEPETARGVLKYAPHLDEVARERVRDEFLSILSLEGAKGSLEALDRLDLLCRIIPELAETKGVEQPVVHYWDVWGHTLHSVEAAERVTKGHQNSPVYTLIYWTAETDAYFSQEACDGHTRRTLLKLAALLHDISKPQTKHKDEHGRTRFPGHSEMGAEVSARRLTELRLETKGVNMVSKMVEHHLRPGHMMQGVEVPTPRAVHRFYRDVGDVAVDTLYLSQADFLAAKGPELNPVDWANHARMIAHIVQAGFQREADSVAHPLVNGNDLIEHFSLQPGPIIGRLLECIHEAHAAGEISTREEAFAMASQEIAQYTGGTRNGEETQRSEA